MLKLLLLITAVVSYQKTEGGVISNSVRHPNLNRYYVYVRETNRQYYELANTEASINSSTISPSRDTAIIIHGHQGSAFDSLNPVVKDAFLTAYNLNVIVVDWSVHTRLSYSNAAGAVPFVGIHIADLITSLVHAGRVELSRLHIVGFNLGAHVAGFTGRSLGGQVARITGLDPSGRQWGSNSGRLTSTDARYVEVIHTDGDGLFSNGIGTAIGHVDFFVNGGNNQPGCLRSSTCSHNRAWEYFAASLINNHLIGNRCASSLQVSTNNCRGYTLHMGNNDYVKFGSGTFRVNTRRTFPF